MTIVTLQGLENEQSLHHFLTESPWSAQNSEEIDYLPQFYRIKEKNFLIDDETGDKKEKRQIM